MDIVLRCIGTGMLISATLVYMLFYVIVERHITVEQYMDAYGEPDEEMREYLESETNLNIIKKHERLRMILTFGTAGFGLLLALISLII